MALELPREVRVELASWAHAAAGEDPGLRLVDEGSLHVTLCFLGSLDVSAVAAIASRCARAVESVGELGPARLRATGALWLPRRRPRVLAVALEDADGRAGRYQAALARELADGGWYTPEARPWLPHVTVARVRERRAGVAGSDLSAPGSGWFDAGVVALMRSRLGSGPARYERLAAVVLTRSGR